MTKYRNPLRFGKISTYLKWFDSLILLCLCNNPSLLLKLQTEHLSSKLPNSEAAKNPRSKYSLLLFLYVVLWTKIEVCGGK